MSQLVASLDKICLRGKVHSDSWKVTSPRWTKLWKGKNKIKTSTQQLTMVENCRTVTFSHMALWQRYLGSCSWTDGGRGSEFEINLTELSPEWARRGAPAECMQHSLCLVPSGTRLSLRVNSGMWRGDMVEHLPTGLWWFWEITGNGADH